VAHCVCYLRLFKLDRFNDKSQITVLAPTPFELKDFLDINEAQRKASVTNFLLDMLYYRSVQWMIDMLG
jgi:hypothetical protein